MGEIAKGDGQLIRHLFGLRNKEYRQSAINNLKELIKESYTPEDFSCSASFLMDPLQ